MKHFTLILIITILCKLTVAQSLDLYEGNFASSNFYYHFDKKDSSLSRYNNNIEKYNPFFFCKATYNISPNGFGFKQHKKSIRQKDGTRKDFFDSIFVSLEFIDSNYVVKFYDFADNEKESIINKSYFITDTVYNFDKFLNDDSYTFPGLSIYNTKTKEKVLNFQQGKLKWLTADTIYNVDKGSSKNTLINNTFNNLIKNNYLATKLKKSKKRFKVDAEFFSFSISLKQYNKLISDIELEQNFSTKARITPINFQNSKIADDLRKNIFVSQNLKPVVFYENNNALIGSRKVYNIFEVNDSLIRYTDLNQKNQKTDTLTVSVKQIGENNYVLTYSQFENENFSSFDAFGRSFNSSMLTDTIISFQAALNDSILLIDQINVKDPIGSKPIYSIDFKRDLIFNHSQSYELENCDSIRNIITNFLSKAVSKSKKANWVEVSVYWNYNGFKFPCPEKSIKKLIKKVDKELKTSR